MGMQRVFDKDNAFLYLTEVMSTGVSFNDFFKSCMTSPNSPLASDSVAISGDKSTNNEETNDGNLQQHIESVHEDNIQFKCDYCDYSCDLKDNLQQHVASIHEDKKPFRCESCDFSCDLKANLQQHVASVHEGKKPLNCESKSQKTRKVCKSTWLGIKCDI